ncbi:MAG: signal peptidase I [Lachnospiraceae bacterium]|jgi:signal peptidase I|nr:signal peptidase I [Lachnospiraceae bacterium]MCI9012548.1 signal peptidase I [Lachnospiraceae bacterium]MCI9254960.1 signal peptidase I [Lachnospiraceae bacterium]
MKKVLKEILSTSLYILFVLCAVYLVIHFVGQRTQVQGSSMEPKLSNEDNLIVDKISYRFHDPERFDIVVFPFRYEENIFYIKRVIGLPGETIRIDEKGNILINGEILEESYGKEVIQSPGRAYEEIVLADDEYFLMGDNRNNSTDSRDPSVGNVRRDEIVGRAWLRIWPLDQVGFIEHR